LRTEIDWALGAVRGARGLTLRTGAGCELRLARGDRPWLSDDGIVDEADRAAGAGVSNLPGGSIYSTVLEDAAEGALWLPQAGAARDVTLHFREGRVVEIEAREGAAELGALFDRHSGESRRISHVGIGLNPALRRSIGWVLVDEHVHGALFVAFGENRYMGGENASSLNVDFCVPDATVCADDRTIVREGQVVVT
jgi:leucyl aminopeptidase (aminopeptidase T)